ncbi:ABC transporter permease [Streptomyces sp. NPDC050255]|uniref:ABC transporter permease n=1 Tax=Streptomyces sp. NPDC050255 TaxID=3365606 RepID=UPI0037B7E4CD
MIWLTWRQYRVQTLVALAALAAVGIALVITGTQMRASYDGDVAGCSTTCEAAKNAFVHEYESLGALVTGLLVVVPGVIGIFWGAPLIARELETGTHRLIWNQSISRSRWLAVKLTAVGLSSVAVTGLLSLMVTWWARPLDEITSNRFDPLLFDGRGVAPLGYAAFAFTVGVCAGLLIRRTVPAMAVTLGLFAAVQILMPYAIRPLLMEPVRAEVALAGLGMAAQEGRPAEGAAWSATDIMLSGDGENAQVKVGLSRPGAWVLSDLGPVLNSAGEEMRGSAGCAARETDPVQCFAKSDFHVAVEYQPGDRYWTFQWIETGIFVALAGILAGFSAWWLRRRLD